MVILTILNTLGIFYLILSNKTRYSVTVRKEKTFINNTLVGYEIILWKDIHKYSRNIFSIYIPIKNKDKIELKEEKERLMRVDNEDRIYRLNAKFSWFKSQKEVDQFKKDYLSVDPELVEKLVNNFKPKNI